MDYSDYESEVASSLSADASFTFVRGSEERRIERRLKKSQINADRLSLMFQVDKSTVHLVDEFNDCTEWPNRDGRFDLRSFPDGSYIKVEGSAGQASLSSSTPNSTFSQSRSYSQLFSSVIPTTNLPHKAKKARVQSYSLKITYAALEGGKIKNPSRQLYILITEETANVEYIQKQCEDELKVDNVVLATSNGLLIEDSVGTRGLAFWKATARKIYAVKNKVKTEPEAIVVMDDSEKVIGNSQNEEKILNALQEHAVDIKLYVDKKFEEIQDNSLICKMKELFKCVVCQETAKPEIKFGGCCCSILGCQSCLDVWYQENENCPKCRSALGRSVLYTLRGFDDVIIKLEAGI